MYMMLPNIMLLWSKHFIFSFISTKDILLCSVLQRSAQSNIWTMIFSSPGRSPGRAIVLTLASALASVCWQRQLR